MPPLVTRILDALPQTQCTRCGFPDCEGYARAIVADEAGIHLCPPGGAEGVGRLSALTGQSVLPIDPQCGSEGPRSMAVIDEAWCIGCTLCLDACPTDAILGFSKRMHTVVEAHCTGCELCIPVCPVDCISLEVATPGRTGWQAWSGAQADAARVRYRAHVLRGAERAAETARRADTPDADRKRSIVDAALARARGGTPSADAVKKS